MMNTKPNPMTAGPAEGVAGIGMETAEVGTAPLNAAQRDALREALEDLRNLDEYAKEMDLLPARSAAREAARVFLQEAVQTVPLCYAISPWDDKEVIVYAQDKKKHRVSIYFNTAGSATCYVTHPKKSESKQRHFPKMDKTATKWIFDALRKLEE